MATFDKESNEVELFDLLVKGNSAYLRINERYGLVVEDGKGSIVYNKDVFSQEGKNIPIIQEFDAEITYKDGFFHFVDNAGKSVKLNEVKMRELCLNGILAGHGGELEGSFNVRVNL